MTKPIPPLTTALTGAAGLVLSPLWQQYFTNLYSEGEWAPVLGGSTGTSGQTYSTQAGRYGKVGRLVFATATVALTVLGTVTGTVIVQGLPFQAEAHTANAPAWSVGVAYFSLPGSWASISGFIQPSTNFIYLQGVPAGGATAPVFLTPANLANTSTFILTASYLAQD